MSDPNAQVPFYADRQLANEIQVIQSDDVRTAVEQAYKGSLHVGNVTASVAQAGSDAVVLSVSSTKPKDAADLVNLYAEKYVEFSQTQLLNSLDAANTQLQKRLASITEKRNSIAAPLTAVTSQLAANPGNAGLVAAAGGARRVAQARARRARRPAGALRQGAGEPGAELAAHPRGRRRRSSTRRRRRPPRSRPSRSATASSASCPAWASASPSRWPASSSTSRSARAEDLERTAKGRYPILGVIPEGTAAEMAGLPGVGRPLRGRGGLPRAAHLGALRGPRPTAQGHPDHLGLRR